MKLAFFEASDGSVGFQYVDDDQTVPAGWLVLTQEEAEVAAPEWGQDRVWDRTIGGPRARTTAEKLAKAKTEQEDLVRDAANSESSEQVRAFEARIVAAKWAKGSPLNSEESAILSDETARYNKLVNLVAQVRGATTIDQVKGITW